MCSSKARNGGPWEEFQVFYCDIAGCVFGRFVPPVAASHNGPSGALVVILQLFIFDGAGAFFPSIEPIVVY